MKKCDVCHQLVADNQRSEHHYWHPKRFFVDTPKSKKKIIIHRKCHTAYNTLFDNNCRLGRFNCAHCKYKSICCYYELRIKFVRECQGRRKIDLLCQECNYQTNCVYIDYSKHFERNCRNGTTSCIPCKYTEICFYYLCQAKYETECKHSPSDELICQNCRHHRHCHTVNNLPERRKRYGS